jgi:predicted chitinase
LQIQSLVPTVLKKRLADSSLLSTEEKVLVKQGVKYNIPTSSRIISSHLETELDGKTWYLYCPHWQGLESFPCGFPKPLIDEKVKATEMIEAIAFYCLQVGITSHAQVAYVLATAEGESNFKPVKEYRGKQLTPDQQKYWDTNYMGRGLIQVTWESNYRRVGNRLGIDLLKNPDLLLTNQIAIASLVLGMRDGWYTGKKIRDYKLGDYWYMRAIVNPGEIKYARYHQRAKHFVTLALKWQKYLEKYCRQYRGLVIES